MNPKDIRTLHSNCEHSHDGLFRVHLTEADYAALIAEVERLTADVDLLKSLKHGWKVLTEKAISERDAAFSRGVAAMREAAVVTLEAAFAAGDNNLFPQGVAYGLRLVRALPDPGDKP